MFHMDSHTKFNSTFNNYNHNVINPVLTPI